MLSEESKMQNCLFFFFDVDIFLKSLLNLLQYCFCFMPSCFGHEACGQNTRVQSRFNPRPGIEPTPPALEGKVSTTGPPGKSRKIVFTIWSHTGKNEEVGKKDFKKYRLVEQLGPWATTTEPARLEPVLRNKRRHDSERPAHRDEEWSLLAATRESPRTETKTQHSQK